MKQELEKASSAEHIRWKHSQLCIKRIAEGLRDLPVIDAAATMASAQVGKSNRVC